MQTMCRVRILLPVLLSIVSIGCHATNGPGSSAARPGRAIFLADLKSHGIKVERELPDGRIELSHDDYHVTVSMDNKEREFAASHDPAVIHQFASATIAGFPEPLTWQNARASLYPVVETPEMDAGDSLRKPLADGIVRMAIHLDRKRGQLRFITPSDLANWHVREKDVESEAGKNLAALVLNRKFVVKTVGPLHLGYFDCSEPIKASFILSLSFKKSVSRKLGWPVLVGLPNRDVLYVGPEREKSHIELLASTVVDGYKNDAYPITPDIFEVSDDGIRLFGKFAHE